MAELIPFVLLLGLMWFLLIRPQQARLRKQRELVSSIEVGQQVLTAGGLIGTVRVLTDDELHLEVSPGVEVRMVRAAVTRRLDGLDAEEDDAEEDDAEENDLGEDDAGEDDAGEDGDLDDEPSEDEADDLEHGPDGVDDPEADRGRDGPGGSDRA